MATTKKAPAKTAAPVKKTTVTKKAAPAKAVAVKAAAEPVKAKPFKDKLNKTQLTAHLAAASGVELKGVRAVLAALESTMLASLHKKGAGEFAIPGLVRVAAIQVPAKKARKGINPFTKEEQVFKAKPATVKLRATFFKKLKDAAI
ncbi:nucleoid DNA-binding protein [Rhodoferax ferrireducens]|uniref:Nucleoid DNA-binding protein n=1 Tax=Rhodoferax ferrireducens TaxID=192843 RepID=A0ABU2CD46_9BURK|nr:HU family DNA-binding protein [Rhodoferax ferrireducens]MDR7379259.1 nucleoid DNA-binding protein [Rhodoferax ferrireducens]